MVGLRSPEGETRYIAAAFPSACGKTNLAMLMPPAALGAGRSSPLGTISRGCGSEPTVACGPSIPRPATSASRRAPARKSNANAMAMVEHDSIFTNVATTAGRRCLVGGHGSAAAAAGLIDWRGRPWIAHSGEKAAHPNSRFTAPMANNPVLSPMPKTRKACRFRRSYLADGVRRRCPWYSNRSTGRMAL